MSRTRAAPASRRLAPQAQSILVEIARSLEVVEQRLTALARHTPHAGPYAQELREIRLQIAALLARPESAAPGE